MRFPTLKRPPRARPVVVRPPVSAPVVVHADHEARMRDLHASDGQPFRDEQEARDYMAWLLGDGA